MWPEVKKWVENVGQSQTVLDIGCGNGRLLTALSISPVNYLGVDIAQVMIDQARTLHPDHHFVCADVLDQKFWQTIGSYDHIFVIAMLHHLQSRDAQVDLLGELAKHLKPKGHLYLTVWNLWQPRYWRYHFSGLKWSDWRCVQIPFQGIPRPCFAMDKQYLKKIIAQTGLEIEDIYYSDKKGMKTSWFKGQNLCAILRS